MYHIIRTPTWILPPRVASLRQGPAGPLMSQIELDANDNFTPAQIARFESDPSLCAAFEAALDSDQSVKHALTLDRAGVFQQWAQARCRDHMAAALGGDARLCGALIPEHHHHPLGCRRMTPAPGYLEAMRDPRLELVTDQIARFVEGGIELATGRVVEVDAVVCATGFDGRFVPDFEVKGRKGTLEDVFREEGPKAYMSLAVPGFPNFFSASSPLLCPPSPRTLSNGQF
jgi:cation diffusion facilitator CzcD-associated flavoprotein CzcO